LYSPLSGHGALRVGVGQIRADADPQDGQPLGGVAQQCGVQGGLRGQDRVAGQLLVQRGVFLAVQAAGHEPQHESGRKISCRRSSAWVML
jgi:hypothetical protein